MSQGSNQIQAQEQLMLQSLSPQQILVIKLLELPNVELRDRIHAEVLDNPALEEGKEISDSTDSEADAFDDDDYSDKQESEDITLGDYLTEDDIPDYKLLENNHNRGQAAEDIPFSESVSFYEYLKEQLDMRPFSPREKEIVEYLIGSLDDDGWLRKGMSTLIDELCLYCDINSDTDELERMLAAIQDFDPAGIGARNLQECLLLQLKRKPDSVWKQNAQRILKKCFDDFTHKNKERILQRLDISEEEYDEAVSELTKLNPRPGSSLGEVLGKNMQQIIPDFYVETQEDGNIIMTVNSRDIPKLRLNREFHEMLEEHTNNKDNQSKASNDAFLFLKQKVESAQGFIDAIKIRQNTLEATMRAIIDIQRPFFLEGDESLLKPMILKDVAKRAKLDISTISRVSNSKYVQTNYGVFPLKYFFVDGFSKKDGEEESIWIVKKLLKEFVENEDKNNPYKDDELAEMLKEKGYTIARRTIAKYRDDLNIPTARLRR